MVARYLWLVYACVVATVHGVEVAEESRSCTTERPFCGEGRDSCHRELFVQVPKNHYIVAYETEVISCRGSECDKCCDKFAVSEQQSNAAQCGIDKIMIDVQARSELCFSPFKRQDRGACDCKLIAKYEPCPTASPTKSPTNSPTKTPTRSPTGSPTRSPTPEPTKTPTGSPTQNPTKSPTTLRPTHAPTRAPTSAGTKKVTPLFMPYAIPDWMVSLTAFLTTLFVMFVVIVLSKCKRMRTERLLKSSLDHELFDLREAWEDPNRKKADFIIGLRIAFLFVSIFDFATDTLFGTALLRTGETFYGRLVIVFIAVPILVNFCLGLWIHRMLLKKSEEFREWEERDSSNALAFAIGHFFGFLNVEAFLLINGGTFGGLSTMAPFSPEDMRIIQSLSFANNLFEDLPQITIVLLYQSQAASWDTISIISLISSILSFALTVVIRLNTCVFTCHEKRSQIGNRKSSKETFHSSSTMYKPESHAIQLQ